MKRSDNESEWINPRADARECARDFVGRDHRGATDSREYAAARRRSRREMKRDERSERGEE